jgi:Phosphatidylinositol 3- and 4-kinase
VNFFFKVADDGGAIAGLGSYVMMAPTQTVSELKAELQEYLGIPQAQQEIWLQLPDDFPLEHVLNIIEANVQVRPVVDENLRSNGRGRSPSPNARRAGGAGASTSGDSLAVSNGNKDQRGRRLSSSTQWATAGRRDDEVEEGGGRARLAASLPVVPQPSRSKATTTSVGPGGAPIGGAAATTPSGWAPAPLQPAAASSAGGGGPSPGTDVFVRIGRYAAANEPAEMLKYCQTLPKSYLMLAMPVLIAFNSPPVNQFIYDVTATDRDLQHRVQLLVHRRPRFSHITTEPLKDGVIQLCEDNAEAFEKGQKHRWVGRHPINGEAVKAVKVDYVFSSLARPVILSYYADGQASVPLPPRTICKTGEDIYNETAVQILFKQFDELWRQKLPERYRPELFTFNEVPGGTNLGYVELLEGCCDLEDVERERFARVKDHDRFIRTTCGAVLGTYILGIKDRHRENTLLYEADSIAFPIDFGFMLGLKAPSVNCYCIAISPHFYKYLRKLKRWPEFAAMFLAGFDALREEAHSVIALGKLVFRGVEDKDDDFVGKFLRKKFLMEKNAKDALVKMGRRLRHAPICIDTAHKINSHQKNKKFLDKHRDWALVKGIVKSAENAKPQSRPGRVRGHIGTTKLQLVQEYEHFHLLPADVRKRMQVV